ncbi:helix-turn-helix domain-containing protein [Paenibacillus gorillae]|uniref:helix-turn-helix domain-containing protein n=1 Tax=Paenibacillus gorillae TaxID=1243662 RepID=UPI0006932432|nr:helix-turn-helix transcriptional regulator [Paenibacillus gorillae]
MKSEVIRLKEGEQIKVAKKKFGCTIHGPAIVVVLTEYEGAMTPPLSCPEGCSFVPLEPDDRFCGMCGSKLTIENGQADSLGRYLRVAREAVGLTQLQLANLVGMTEANVSSYERDKSIPPLHVLRKFSPIFNVSYVDLMLKVGYLLETDLSSVNPAAPTE